MTDSSNIHVGGAAIDPTEHGVAFRVVRLEEDVKGLKGDLGEIKTGLKEVAAAIVAKGSMNWGVVGVLAPILFAAVAAVWILFSTYSVHVERTLDEQKVAAAGFMKREDIVALIVSAKEVADLKAQITTGKVERLAGDVSDLQHQIVPLSTHQELWKNQADTNKALAAQIDENRRALGDITAPRDTIARIYKRLDDIEGLTRTHGPATLTR